MEPKDRQTPPDARAQHRAYVLEHVVNGGLTIDQAATILKLSTRQVDRLRARHADGPAALAHGNRGRPPANRIDAARRARVVELATTTYAWVNHTHLAELLAEREGLEIAERTLRRILAEASVRPTRTRRPPRHRNRRERMAREGQLLGIDGSRHRWFGPDLGFATLVAGIDDATGRVPGGTFRAQEDAVDYVLTFAQTAERHGLPGAVYSDRHGIFIVEKNRAPTLAEQLTGTRSLTQVGRALDEAAIGWIGARSAEAKGRVERLWGTLQDRLVAELRLAGITTIEAANAFLPDFLERHNARFVVPAADPEPAWRPWPDGLSAKAVSLVSSLSAKAEIGAFDPRTKTDLWLKKANTPLRDQLGGRPANGSDPGNKQKFRNVTWVNNTTHTEIAGALYKTGHCYPWSAWQTISGAAWDTWTNNNHTDC